MSLLSKDFQLFLLYRICQNSLTESVRNGEIGRKYKNKVLLGISMYLYIYNPN